MTPRPLLQSLALCCLTIAAGLTVRLVQLGLPAFVVKYAGSMLWAAMIYWIVSTLWPRGRVPAVATTSGLVATAVECFKLYHSPGMDAFRTTLPGILLLGRYFSVWDIVAYLVAIAAAALIDRSLLRANS
ncbi:MAG TPA: DUF2809 domain-containing protein [Acidobacteriaceae bacterium]|jgi:hypothetical protein